MRKYICYVNRSIWMRGLFMHHQIPYNFPSDDSAIFSLYFCVCFFNITKTRRAEPCCTASINVLNSGRWQPWAKGRPPPWCPPDSGDSRPVLSDRPEADAPRTTLLTFVFVIPVSHVVLTTNTVEWKNVIKWELIFRFVSQQKGKDRH